MIITAPRVVTALPGAPVLEPGYVVTSGNRITDAGQGPPPGTPDVELGEGVLVPGLVDLQLNGYFGVEMGAAEPAAWAIVAERLPRMGCTAFLPTFITAPVRRLATALGLVAENAAGRRWRGARVLGVHVEGPFISPARRGAHNPDWIVPPAPGAVAELLEAGAGLVRLVTLAPEVDGGLAAVRQLAEAGVLVSVGHSNATAAQVAAAAGAGARMVTHLFNGQPSIKSREPGVAGQALADPRLTSGLIMDTYHVAPANCALAFAAAPGRICLVTDAAPCAGMPPGEYLLGGEPITLPPGDGVPPHRPDGGLAGSALRIDRAVANMVALLARGDGPPDPPGPASRRLGGDTPPARAASPAVGLAAGAGAELAAAVAAASRVPADLIGRPDLGRLAPGAAADLVWLDEDLRAAGTWINGERVYP
ncbi:MAG: amidohydrolase family protein [Streptosporangiaceae bacterium]